MPINRRLSLARRAGYFLVLLMLPVLAGASGPSPADPPAENHAAAADIAAADTAAAEPDDADAADADADAEHAHAQDTPLLSSTLGPPGQTAGLPSPEELEAAGAVIGKVLIDNQNIFNLEDPKDDNWFGRAADDLHPKTHAEVISHQLLFKPGERYSRRLIDESERILRADGYFYDAWIREVSYHDNQVDLRVTTRDVWTLNPGFNFSRSGGTNSLGVQLED
ncbi:MAG TPA: POTRA domain-containing protein, partial [Steroidobacteraceae bacterium]